jgi:hypothetical protein
MIDEGGSAGYTRAGKNGVNEKNKGIRWKQFLAPHFLSSRGLLKQILGGPSLTSGILVRG